MTQLLTKQMFNRDQVTMLFLIGVFWLAFALRWVYFLDTNRIVDEYTSMLSIRAILTQGVPILPSGRLYGPKGLLHGYLGALSALAFGRSEFSLCFQSAAAGLLAVGCIYRVGRDYFSSDVGRSAALALACLPSAVQWGGRVRMYSLWQLLSLVGVYLLIKGYLSKSVQQVRIIGLLVMSLAMLTHTLSLIVLGGLVVSIGITWIVSLRRRGSRPSFSLFPGEVLAAIFLIAVTIIIDPLGGPWGGQVKMSEVAQGVLTIQHIQERFFYLLVYTYEFVTWPLWPLTVFYVVGFIRLGWKLVRKSFTADDLIVLNLYILLLVIWSATAILSHIQRNRYLFSIIPFFLLLSLREFVGMIRLLGAAWGGFWNTSTFVSIALLGLLVPSTIRMMSNTDVGDLSAAYYYVREHWQPRDAVAACHPVPSQWFLNRVDYYAIDIYVGVRDGVDVWAGAPLVNTPEKFAKALDAHERVWYVADDLCWEAFLQEDFRLFVERNMTVAYNQEGVKVFVSSSD